MQRRVLLPGAGKFLRLGNAARKYSLAFVAGSISYLTLSHANWGSYTRSKFAISFWIKNLSTGTADRVICIKGDGQTASTEWQVRILSSGKLQFLTYSGATNTGGLLSTATYTSLSQFYHVLLHYDSANATAGDRMRMWVDGTEVTAFDTDTNPTTLVDTVSTAVSVGAENDAGTPNDMIIHQWAFFNNVLPAVATLRDTTTGKPINPAGLTGCIGTLSGKNAVATRDGIKSTSWTNNGNVFVTTQIP